MDWLEHLRRGFCDNTDDKTSTRTPRGKLQPGQHGDWRTLFSLRRAELFFSSVLAWLLRQSLVCNDCDDPETTMMMMNTLMRLFLFLFCRAGKGKAKRFLMKPHDTRQKEGKRGWDFLPT